ncbi:MAG: Spy/CpxP family protein refolding chaperone [Candidatus Eisenbacteria bacterium]|nr:Spy/CpxP family protein refolding chaperone [Candidatus Eisenbacteria bacterium]
MNGRMRNRSGSRLPTAGVVVMMILATFLFGGCKDEAESPVGSDLTSAAPTSNSATLSAAGEGIELTIDQIDAALDLTDEQAAALAPVVAEWTEAMEERRAEMQSSRASISERTRGRRGAAGRMHGRSDGAPEPPDGDPPLLTLLEGSRETLTSEQYTGLIELLAAKHQEHRAAMGAARDKGAGKDRGRAKDRDRGFMGFPDELVEQIGLTDEQRAALEELHESIRARMEELRGNGGERGENREAMRAIHEETRAAVDAILTEEQRTEMEALREERRDGQRERAEERSTDGIERRADFLARALGLDDGARAGIESILENAHEKMLALRDDDGGPENRGARFEEMQTIRDESSASIRALLTEEQAAAFDALAELMPGHDGPGGRHGPPRK